ncbi:nuclear transport factor 2 family protein [Bacillus sp. AK031]
MSHSTLKEQLLNLEERLLNSEVRVDTKELEKVLAEGFFEFGSSGNVWLREDCLKDGGISVRDMSVNDFEIHPLAENVVLTTYRVKDNTKKQVTLRSSIWKLLNGKWQMYFHQGTISKYE